MVSDARPLLFEVSKDLFDERLQLWNASGYH